MCLKGRCVHIENNIMYKCSQIKNPYHVSDTFWLYKNRVKMRNFCDAAIYYWNISNEPSISQTWDLFLSKPKLQFLWISAHMFLSWLPWIGSKPFAIQWITTFGNRRGQNWKLSLPGYWPVSCVFPKPFCLWKLKMIKVQKPVQLK